MLRGPVRDADESSYITGSEIHVDGGDANCAPTAAA
jgi:hypothetical protein